MGEGVFRGRAIGIESGREGLGMERQGSGCEQRSQGSLHGAWLPMKGLGSGGGAGTTIHRESAVLMQSHHHKDHFRRVVFLSDCSCGASFSVASDFSVFGTGRSPSRDPSRAARRTAIDLDSGVHRH